MTRRISAVGLASFVVVAASGCFYVDPINQRPSIEIVAQSSDQVFHGDTVELHALISDPDSDNDVTLTWHAYLCDDATDKSTCDVDAFYTEDRQIASFGVPVNRSDAITQVKSIRVELDGVDAGGAVARPQQSLAIPITNRPPDVAMRKIGRNGYVVGTPVTIFAQYGDVDSLVDSLPDVTGTFEVFTPNVGATFTAPELTLDTTDPLHPVASVVLTSGSDASNLGEWQVRFTATDSSQSTTVQTETVELVPDRPPCLAVLQPTVPPIGVTVPVTEPTLFSVPIVVDDLDVYPPNPNDGVLGVTRFKWSIKPPGASARQAFGTGSSVELDPAAFTIGDVVELRVEVFDRVTEGSALGCPDGDATCSILSDQTCLQRQTWKVEIR